MTELWRGGAGHARSERRRESASLDGPNATNDRRRRGRVCRQRSHGTPKGCGQRLSLSRRDLKKRAANDRSRHNTDSLEESARGSGRAECSGSGSRKPCRAERASAPKSVGRREARWSRVARYADGLAPALSAVGPRRGRRGRLPSAQVGAGCATSRAKRRSTDLRAENESSGAHGYHRADVAEGMTEKACAGTHRTCFSPLWTHTHTHTPSFLLSMRAPAYDSIAAGP